MKKITILSIVIALVLACAFGISVNAADNSSFKAGDSVVVKFALGDTMKNGDYTITYNPDALEFKSVTPSASAKNDSEAGKVVVTFFGAEATEVVATFTAKTVTDATSAQVSLVPEKFKNTSGENKTADVKPATQTVTVTPSSTEENVVKNEVPSNEVNDNVVADNEVIENEVKTPVTTNTVKNDNDDKATYDQTGANIAIVAVVALAVVLGSAFVIKRK